jgi:hypothetical protein
MRRHVRTVCKIPPTKKNGATGMQLLYARTLKQQEAELAEMREKVARLERAAPATITNNTLIINVFGAENFKHVPARLVHEILLGSDSMPTAAGALGSALYCDPAHPENLTCHMANVREGQVLVREPAGWRVRQQSAVFPLIHRSVTDVAFDKQPTELADAQAAAPILQALARAETDGSYPVDAYRAVLVAAKKLQKNIAT